MEPFKQKTESVTQKLKEELQSIRTGRPQAALVENLEVEYYGQKIPLKQAGTATVIPPREIKIQAWDEEGAKAISKAIESSSLGLTANTEGVVIRVFLPELSVERREELSKHIKKTTETYRIQIRGAREDARASIDRQEKEGTITKDDQFKQKEQIQKETEEANKKIEELLEAKLKEINE